MGAFSSDTPRLLWLCTIAACLLFIVNSYHVSADSKTDTDLVFDTLEHSNLKNHENHPRIERDLSSEKTVSNPQEEPENWLISGVKRLKRSIGSIFNKNEDHTKKPEVHHKKAKEFIRKKVPKNQKKVPKNQRQAHVTSSKRKHRQVQDELGQQETDEDEEGDEFVEEDEDYANTYDDDYDDAHFVNGSNNNDDDITLAENSWSDDEDDLINNSGEGSTGESPVTEDGFIERGGGYGHPRVYRFIFSLLEPYVSDFNDRNSNAFQNLASRIKTNLELLFRSLPGNQYATVISIQRSESDTFKVIVTVDVDSNNFYDSERIRRAVFDEVHLRHRLGNLTASPENFFFREFGETPSKCASNELQCRSGQCVPLEARCNNIQECNDNTDEEGCVVTETDPVEPVEPVRPETEPPYPPFESLTSTTTTTTTTTTEYPYDGSGDNSDCRGDDAVRCPDGSRSICADQQCDGISDCDDGSDERNCPSHECAEGEFKCDVTRCIPIDRLCDTAQDCSDGTDEHNCPPKCTIDEHQCDEKCISRDQVCDGIDNCEDRTDEANCPVSQCQIGEFPCGDGQCIPDYLRCDGGSDCRNGNDESNCTRACTQEQFDCGDECISIGYRCDGYQDCKDGRDENNCGPVCSSNEFECPSDRTCIPIQQRCDRRSDCSDGADEFGCTNIPRCTSNQLTCSDGSCIEIYKQCDGVVDCPSGSDEEGCPCQTNEFQCLDNGRCIDINLRCNRQNDCSDGSDEYNCPTVTTFAPETTRPPISCPVGYRPCNSLTQCIREEQVCDSRADCNDLSDEIGCRENNGLDLKTYPNSQEIKENREVVFQCRDEGPLRARVHWARPNGQPLPPAAIDRNGRLEIPDIKVQDSGTYLCIASGYPPNTPGAQVPVELTVSRWITPTTLRPPTACALYQATCSNGDCIDKNKVCDGTYDCADGSDENRCNVNGCEPNQFQCNNKKCVLKTWRCDSDNDCGDGSDEENCGTSPPGALCQYHQFTCHSNNQCIPRSYHCDNERDCIDGSDEIGCSKPVISKPPPPMENLHQHDTLIITCTAVGIPTPEIVWRLNWGHIPPKCRTTSVNGVGELICEDMQVEDQGAYSCEAINNKGSIFAVPDTIVVVTQDSPCRPGYFNDEARTESECIKCFCFGHTTNCHSADLFIYQFQPPFDSLRMVEVQVDPTTGVVNIRDEPREVVPQLISLGSNGVYASAPEFAELSQLDIVPYFALPENYHGNQLKSYGGYLRYTVRHSNRGYPVAGPDVIITGNGYTLLHQNSRQAAPNNNQNFEVRFFEGEWLRKSDRARETTATREEIMMVLEDIDNVLIKLQYNEGILNTSLTNIEMDSAAAPNSGLGAASYVEQCICPVGYAGNSCEKCASGYVRQQSGPWLGQCYKEPETCPPGRFFDGRNCQVCPCPLTNPSNQFGRTCQLGSGGQVICDCQPGYEGDRCQYCSPGYVGNPLTPGDSCRPVPSDPCNSDGSLGYVNGRCRCKDLTEGPYCDQCKRNTFYLSATNRFGCIACFCMGITEECTSSNWYRDQITSEFTNSLGDFKLVDTLNRDIPIEEGIRLNQQSREIVYNDFASSNAFYWSLPPRFLGDKITSYGGYLRYTLRHTPVPGGQSSRNSAADVELISKNQYHLLYFNPNQTYPTREPQTFSVPLLEQYWQRFDGKDVDREHLLMALADLDAIYIKATYYTNTEEAALISVSLDIADERNTGRGRALEVEQCRCPAGYTGLSCEDCDVGYTRNYEGIYLGLCEPCNCNGHSNHCDADTGVCLDCRDFTTGDNCERCLPGYNGDPVNGRPCVYENEPPVQPCNCDPRGSVSSDCVNGRCICKVNVEGNNCDRCREGAFGLSSNSIDGCEFCFCSGLSTECRESNLYFEQIPRPFTQGHGFTLTDQRNQIRISDRFNVNMFFTEISYNFLPSQRERLFWSLPSIFTGNKIKSYGGKLEFIQRYTQRPEARYVPDQDVIISGNGITIYWSHPVELREDIVNPVSVSLHPSANWFRLDQNGGLKPASREDILMVLANIDYILIRATQSSDTSTAYLSDVTLETAVEQNIGKPRATSVEVCRCPVGYRGTSCESCAPGYYKDYYYGLSRPLGSCILCPCNNRSESCEMGQGRVICHCLRGYAGERCEYTDEITTTLAPPNSTFYPPTIEIKIVNPVLEIKKVGSSVTYNCTATSRISPRTIRIHWSKLGGELPPNAIDDGRGILVITDLRVTDSGSYICEASDGVSIATSTVTLNVGIPEDEPPRIALSNTFVDVNESQRIEVTCAARGIPTPDYRLVRLDNQPLNPSYYFENGIFRIDRALTTDEGRYQCIATNRAGSDAATFQIQVHRIPGPTVAVEIQPSSYSGKTGDSITFRCNGPDAQSITWTKQGGQLPYSSREDRGMLTIYNAVVEDSGIYICTIVSYSGTRGSRRATVTITANNDRVYPTAKVSPERVTISEGQSLEILCTATGVPSPSIKWTKLGGELSNNMEQIGSVLHIRNARIEDRGVYVCVSTNIYGIEQASAMVDVTRGAEFPRIEIYPAEQQTVVSGDSVILQCRAIAGNPSPTISWSRQNRQPLSSNIEQMSEGALRITQITPNEEGEYVCTATNSAGTVTATASIIVHTRPQIYITPDQDVIRRNEGENLRLECHGSGNPQPNVMWIKYNYENARADAREYLASFGQELQTSAYQEFFSLTREDSGLYICRALSTAGTEERRVQLVVDNSPQRGDITERPYYPDETSSRPNYKDNEPSRRPGYNERFTAPVGTRAELRCRISDQETGSRIRVQWVRANNSSLPREAYEISGTLYIENVQPSAAGEYQCLGIDNADRVVFRLNTYLEVISPPRVTLYPPKQVVHPGEHAYINCSATGEQPITISWTPIGREMPASVYTRDGIIRFSNIQLQDAGRYRCRAVNTAGEADAVADVIVEENVSRPTITAEQRRQVAPLGSTVSLHCKTANPTNSVRWIRENLPLPRNSRVDGEYLYIYNVESEDEGRYYCEISTQMGTASDYIDLELSKPEEKCQPGWWLCENRNCIPQSQYCDTIDDCGDNSDEKECQFRIRRGQTTSPPPTLYITPPESDHFVGESIDIACQSNEPGVITVWSKVQGWMANNVENVGGTLRIHNLRSENGGVYRCEATGHQGVYYKDYNLNVIEEEVKDEAPIEIKRAPRQANVVLECNTDLEDPVTYLWTKQGGDLPSYVDIYSKQIQLNDVGSKDAGTYTCSASSGVRSTDVPIILVVTGIVPYFTQAPTSYMTRSTLGDSFIQFSFEISIRPERGNGLILYNGNKGNDISGDYIALLLVDGVPEFKFNLGQSTTTVRSDQPITNKEWHTIKVVRNRKKVTMYVDGKGPYIGTAEGKYIGLDLTEHLYLGGVPDPYNISPEVFGYNRYEGFVGCISRFKIGHVHEDILHDSLNMTGITSCESCSESSCENNGACQEALTKEGYMCICPSRFSGPTCNRLKGEACSPYACGVGRCVDTENSFECLCPLGRSGRRCEREITVNEPAFKNGAYIAYPTPRPARRLKLALRIRPNDVKDGVLLYCSETEEGHGDFISLAIRDRHLEFRFDAGNGVTVIRHNEELVPGQTHVVTASRTLSDGRLMVDGGLPSVGRLGGNHKILNLQTPLYVGGFDKHRIRINDGVKVYSGFNGCISNISISGLDINLIQNITDSSNVEDCSSDDEDVDNNIFPEYAHENNQKSLSHNRQTGCSSNPCLNRARCYPLTSTDYECICAPGFTGKNCETAQNRCAQLPCQNQGVCKENRTHYTCDCLLGFTGVDCEQRIELRGDAHFDGNGYLEFSRDLLPHENDDEDEVIALELSTNSSSGLIFWHGQRPNEDGQGQDYISLAIDNGYLEYSFDLGMGPAIIQNLQKRVDDGERHSVVLKRNGKRGSIEIDNTWIEDGEADGFTNTMNTNGNIYIGGTPNIAKMTGSRFRQGFSGCIHGFELQNSQRIDLGMKAINGLNIKPCSSSVDRFNTIWRGDGLVN